MPRHGGFYLLHPADTRAYMTNVRNVLEQQESFQLWCQLQVARLQYCLELLEQLEDNQTSRPAGSMLNSHFSLELTERNISDAPSLQTPQNHGRDNQNPATLQIRTSPQRTVPANQTITPSRLSAGADHWRNGMS